MIKSKNKNDLQGTIFNASTCQTHNCFHYICLKRGSYTQINMADNKKKLCGYCLFWTLLDERKKKESKRNVWTKAWLKHRERRRVYHLPMHELELDEAAPCLLSKPSQYACFRPL